MKLALDTILLSILTSSQESLNISLIDLVLENIWLSEKQYLLASSIFWSHFAVVVFECSCYMHFVIFSYDNVAFYLFIILIGIFDIWHVTHVKHVSRYQIRREKKKKKKKKKRLLNNDNAKITAKSHIWNLWGGDFEIGTFSLLLWFDWYSQLLEPVSISNYGYEVDFKIYMLRAARIKAPPNKCAFIGLRLAKQWEPCIAWFKRSKHLMHIAY